MEKNMKHSRLRSANISCVENYSADAEGTWWNIWAFIRFPSNHSNILFRGNFRALSVSASPFSAFFDTSPGDVPSPKAWCQAQLFGLCAASRVQRVGCQAQRTFVEGRDLGSRIPEVVRWIMVFWSRKLSIVGIWTSLFLGNLSFEQCSQAVNSLV